MVSKQEQIEKLYQEIIALHLKQRRAQRYGSWAEEELIFKQQEELNEQIKKLKEPQ